MVRQKVPLFLALLVANLMICGASFTVYGTSSEKRLISIKGASVVSAEDMVLERPSSTVPEPVTGFPVSAERELSLVFGVYRPPYVFGKSDTGLDIDMTQAILARKGYKVKILHAGNQQAMKELSERKVDGVIGLSPKEDADTCYTVPFLFYDNVAISKNKNKVVIKKISDLKNYKFLSFQEATEYLGKDYAEMVHELKDDTDIGNQEIQNKMFWTDKVPVIVLDLNVFKYYRKDLAKNYRTEDEVVIHRIFPLTANVRTGAFLDKKVCEDFNKGLQEIKANGDYQKILDRYVQMDLLDSGIVH